MNVYVLMAAVFILLFYQPLARAIRAYLGTRTERGIILEPFELASAPRAVRDELMLRKDQLAALGYHNLGNCTGKKQKDWDIYYSIWIRDMITAEIAISYNLRTCRARVVSAFGQDYMNGTSVAVFNAAASGVSSQDYLHLPGVQNLFRLEEVCLSFIRLRSSGRMPWVPADALEYKRNDLRSDNPYDDWVKQGYYSWHAADGLHKATHKLALTRAWNAFKASFRFRASWRARSRGHLEDTDEILKELGMGNLESLRKPAEKAFPVVPDQS